MSYLDAVILGLIQGLTEFLPVSSSGHLVLAKHILKTTIPGVSYELIVHMGTLMSVIIYFRRRIIGLLMSIFNPSRMDDRKMLSYLVLGTVPAVIVGPLFRDFIKSSFHSPIVTSIFLMITGAVLLLTTFAPRKEKKIGWLNAIIVGIGQALAIFPGISRSGTSISFGLFAGVKPIAAAEFSFLLSIPVIIGAIIFESEDLMRIETELLGQYFTGAIISFLSGLLTVYILLDIVRKGKFKYFGIYCIVVGLFGLIYFA